MEEVDIIKKENEELKKKNAELEERLLTIETNLFKLSFGLNLSTKFIFFSSIVLNNF